MNSVQTLSLDLAALDRITYCDERSAQVKIDGHQTLTVMHVDR